MRGEVSGIGIFIFGGGSRNQIGAGTGESSIVPLSAGGSSEKREKLWILGLECRGSRWTQRIGGIGDLDRGQQR